MQSGFQSLSFKKAEEPPTHPFPSLDFGFSNVKSALTYMVPIVPSSVDIGYHDFKDSVSLSFQKNCIFPLYSLKWFVLLPSSSICYIWRPEVCPPS